MENEMHPLKVVLTGGPCAGKSSVVEAISGARHDEIVVVPESATMLFENGFPTPGVQVSSTEWHRNYASLFQERAYELRLFLEKTFEEIAVRMGAKIIVCDRGILDGAAYVSGGRREFCATFGISAPEALERYDAVIHLESLATGAPELYSDRNNSFRRETLREAMERELATRAAWADHPRYYMVSTTSSFEEKREIVLSIVDHLTSEYERKYSLKANGL